MREIDGLVISQAENDAAWESPVEVRRSKPVSFCILPDLAERAAFLARIHDTPGVEGWLMRVIKERIEIEEVAYAPAKRELKSKRDGPPRLKQSLPLDVSAIGDEATLIRPAVQLEVARPWVPPLPAGHFFAARSLIIDERNRLPVILKSLFWIKRKSSNRNEPELLKKDFVGNS